MFPINRNINSLLRTYLDNGNCCIETHDRNMVQKQIYIERDWFQENCTNIHITFIYIDKDFFNEICTYIYVQYTIANSL